jgi:L-asparaginase
MTPSARLVLLLALGGTIACRETPKGRVPTVTARELLKSVRPPPSLHVTAVDFLKLTIISSDRWAVIAKKIAEEYGGYDGFVITLGTDSLAYLASALSLMLLNLGKPVVLTGAMNPSGFPRSDAERNLLDSIIVAADTKANGVQVVFGGKIIDGSCVSKTNADAYHAFESINVPGRGLVKKGEIVWKKPPPRVRGELELRTKLNASVALITLTPQLHPDFFKTFVSFDGLVIEGYGDGNVPNYLIKVLTSFARRKVLVLATQCTYGSTHHRYEGGKALIEAGALTAGNMTKELALTRLMWSLGHAKSAPDARAIFQAKSLPPE